MEHALCGGYNEFPLFRRQMMYSTNFTLVLSFSLLLIFQLAILFVTFVIGRHVKTQMGFPAWMLAVIFSCIGYVFTISELSTSTQLSKLSFLVTAATLFFALSQGLIILVLKQLTGVKSSLKVRLFLIILVTTYILTFEYGRQFEDFVFRGVLTSLFYFICGTFGLFFIRRLWLSKDSLWSDQLLVPGIAIILNQIICIFRAFYLLNPSVLGIPYDLGVSVTIFSISQFFFTLIFLGISYYWIDQTGVINNKITIESNELKQLLAKKERVFNGVLLSQKSAMLGAYSHLVAHEVNQPLATIQNDADFLKELLIQRADMARENGLVDSIIKENLRAAAVIQAIKGFLSKDRGQSALFSIDDLVAEVVSITKKNLIDQNIKINLFLNASTLIYANKDEIQLVLINLLENAITAFSGAPSSIHLSRQITITTYFEGELLKVKVSDNGPGVQSSIREFLFNLHNTSKEQGAGIGLWLSRNILRRHSGDLVYESTLGGGASFLFYFPRIHRLDDVPSI